MPRGEKNKLTEEQRAEILVSYGKESGYQVAKRFGVSHTAIYKIWKKEVSTKKQPFTYESIQKLCVSDIAGIYAIIDVKTKRTYIGQSIYVKKRLQKHLSNLIDKKHPNIDLQERFNEIGSAGFVYTILEKFEPTEDLKQNLVDSEKDWISLLDQDEKFNREFIGGGRKSMTGDTQSPIVRFRVDSEVQDILNETKAKNISEFIRNKIKSIDTMILKKMIPVFIENDLKVELDPDMEKRVVELIQEGSS